MNYKLRSILCLALILNFQFSILNSQNWTERRVGDAGKSPFISRIIEYKPAPGQFINQDGIGTPEAAQSIIGGLEGLVSLGGFGGYIIVGFDHTIWNDPENPYGVDFTIVGNAISNSSEPGVVMVMRDTNGNGIPDDGEWYELKGGNHDLPTTIRNYTITYKNPNSDEAADVLWTDNMGNSGVLKNIITHRQPYYPLPEIFPDYPQNEVTFTGTLIGLDIIDDDPQYIRIPALKFGYADNNPFTGWSPPFFPDNPNTENILEGNGGDAFDIDWAIDKDGKSVYLEGIDFIKIHTAVNHNAGWLGEISTEICAVIDVSPYDILSIRDLTDKTDIVVYPNPADDFVNICFEERQTVSVEIWNYAGKLFYSNKEVAGNLLTIPIHDFPSGVYMVCIYDGTKRIVKKIVKKG